MDAMERITREEMRALALDGAAFRLKELRAEETRMEAIVKLLGGDDLSEPKSDNPERGTPGRKNPMSDAERAAISKRMKRYWAKRRREQKAAK